MSKLACGKKTMGRIQIFIRFFKFRNGITSAGDAKVHGIVLCIKI
jgi:hypothetical protein